MNVQAILNDTIFFEREVVEKPSEFMLKDINEVISFSKRAENCLKRAKIKNLLELTSITEDALYNIRNAGKKTIEEIKTKVKELGLKFKEEEEF